jgi:hypothetical protein
MRTASRLRRLPVEGFFFGITREVAEHGFHQGMIPRPWEPATGMALPMPIGENSARAISGSMLSILLATRIAACSLAQVLGDHLVGGGHAGTGIHQEQHIVGFFDGHERLLGHFRPCPLRHR